MTMRYNIYRKGLLLLFLTMASCTPFRSDVYNIVKHTYDNGNDTIDFGEVLWFDWDTMYWFPSNISVDEINLIVNINSYWQDVGDRIIFVKGNKIVYYKEYFPNHETPLKRITFDPSTVQKTNKEDAIFLIRKVSDKLYVLSPTTDVMDL